jgi:hypothetical protein
MIAFNARRFAVMTNFRDRDVDAARCEIERIRCAHGACANDQYGRIVAISIRIRHSRLAGQRRKLRAVLHRPGRVIGGCGHCAHQAAGLPLKSGDGPREPGAIEQKSRPPAALGACGESIERTAGVRCAIEQDENASMFRETRLKVGQKIVPFRCAPYTVGRPIKDSGNRRDKIERAFDVQGAEWPDGFDAPIDAVELRHFGVEVVGDVDTDCFVTVSLHAVEQHACAAANIEDSFRRRTDEAEPVTNVEVSSNVPFDVEIF